MRHHPRGILLPLSQFQSVQLTATQQWTSFALTAGCPPDPTDGSIYIPYILINSPTQTSLERTEQLNEIVHTQFHSPTWQQLKSAFLAIVEQDPKHLMQVDFLILDELSLEERTVIVIEKARHWIERKRDEESGETCAYTMYGDGEEEVVWRKYRVPFEDAWAVQCGIEGFCGMDLAETYLVEEMEREATAKEQEMKD